MTEEFKISLETYDVAGQSMSNYINDGVNAGKTMKVVVCEWKESRSLSQNAIYWKWLGEIAKQTKDMIGQVHDVDTYHEHFKKKFCPVSKVVLGKTEVSIQSTKKLSKGDMHHYLEHIDHWAHSAGYVLTIPMECEYKELNDRQNM